MTTDLSRRLLFAGAAVLLLSGFRKSDDEFGQDAAPDHPDDPRWVAFRGVKVVEDKAKGQLLAQFPKDLKAADGKDIEIGGYMTPLEANTEIGHLILTRRNTGCPFCPPNEANEAIEVFLKRKVHYEQRQFFVRGKLKLVASSDQGLFFQIVDATIS